MKSISTFLICAVALSLTLASNYGEHKEGKHDEGSKNHPKEAPKCGSGERQPHPPNCECQTPAPLCPPCNPKAGCRIWSCPCTHDGFTMYPGNEPLNAPRPSWCPKCVSVCDNFAIRCLYPYLQCSAEQVATYKCIEPIEVVEVESPIDTAFDNVEAEVVFSCFKIFDYLKKLPFLQ